MLKKGSKLNSILTGTCPRCQEESMYEHKNAYNLKNIYKMHENCSHCGLHYQIEPSFFYGAMYVSYGLTVGIGVAAFIISKDNYWFRVNAVIYCHYSFTCSIDADNCKIIEKYLYQYVCEF
jgi:uncharacterized protein (DUF983 family)